MKSTKKSKAQMRKNKVSRTRAIKTQSKSLESQIRIAGLVLKATIMKGASSLGNSVESVGKKLKKNGYAIGTQVEKMGDLIEHMNIKNKSRKTTKEYTL